MFNNNSECPIGYRQISALYTLMQSIYKGYIQKLITVYFILFIRSFKPGYDILIIVRINQGCFSTAKFFQMHILTKLRSVKEHTLLALVVYCNSFLDITILSENTLSYICM